MCAMQSNTTLDPVSERMYKAAAKQKWRNGDRRVVQFTGQMSFLRGELLSPFHNSAEVSTRVTELVGYTETKTTLGTRLNSFSS